MGAGLTTRRTPQLAHSLACSLAHFVFANCRPEARRAPGGARPGAGALCSNRGRPRRTDPSGYETLSSARASSGLELSGEQVGAAARGWGAAGSRPWGRLREATEARPAPRIWTPPPSGLAAGNGVLGGATPPSRSETKNTPGPDFPEPGREVVKWDPPSPVCTGLPRTSRRQRDLRRWG